MQYGLWRIADRLVVIPNICLCQIRLKVCRSLKRLITKGICCAEIIQRPYVNGFPRAAANLTLKGKCCVQSCAAHRGMVIAIPAVICIDFFNRHGKGRKVGDFRRDAVFLQRHRTIFRRNHQPAGGRVIESRNEALGMSAFGCVFPDVAVIFTAILLDIFFRTFGNCVHMLDL